jgi:hypothetical protein
MATNSFDYAFEAIDLICKAVKALLITADTTGRHQRAIQDLQILETVLCGVQMLSPTNSSEETRKNVHYCGHFCRPPLDHFFRRLKELEPELDRVATNESSVPVVDSAAVWTAKLMEEVEILQSSIGNGLRVIRVLLCAEKLGHDIATNTSLPRELQRPIEPHQGSLFRTNGQRYGCGHYYNNIHVNGSGPVVADETTLAITIMAIQH